MALRWLLAVALCCSVTAATISVPSVWWVDVNAGPTSAGDCSSRANACPVIQTAVNRAVGASDSVAGDTINIVGGTYPCEWHGPSTGGVYVNKSVSFVAYPTPAAATVTIDCGRLNRRAFYFDDTTVQMVGPFVIANSNATDDAPITVRLAYQLANHSHALVDVSFVGNFGGMAATPAVEQSGFAGGNVNIVSGGIAFIYSLPISTGAASPSIPILPIANNVHAFTRCRFVGNTATTYAGTTTLGTGAAGAVAVYIESSTAAPVQNNSFNFTDSVFESNTGVCTSASDAAITAGAVSIAFLTSDANALNTSTELAPPGLVLAYNSISFDRSRFTGNSGGTAVADPSNQSGIVSPASTAVGVSFQTAVNGDYRTGAGMDFNSVQSRDSVFELNACPGSIVNTGGDGYSGGYAAGALLVLFNCLPSYVEFSSIVITNTTFRSNTAIGGGFTATTPGLGMTAGLNVVAYGDGGTSNAISVVNSTFFNQTATGSDQSGVGGGAISYYTLSTDWEQNDFSVLNCNFSQNSGGSGLTYGAHIAVGGAGAGAVSLYHTAPNNVPWYEYSFLGNSVVFDSCRFNDSFGGYDNQFAGAGAICIYTALPYGDSSRDTNYYQISNSKFAHSLSAPSDGPAVPNGRSGAGAVYFGSTPGFQSADSINVTNSVFRDSAGACGAMYLNGGTQQLTASNQFTLANCTFSDNSSPCTTCFGGALCLYEIPFYIDGCNFTRNSAGYAGGAIFFGQDTVGTLHNSLFTYNSASFSDAIIDQSDFGSLSLDNSTFILSPPATAGLTSTTALNVPHGTEPRGRTRLECPPGFAIFISARLINCQLCSGGSYLIGGGYSIDNDTSNADCLSCPFGAVCDGGSSVRAVSGYFGDPTVSNRSFVACQPGFCCAGDSNSTDGGGSCSYQDICRTEITHRTGTLCSLCETGYSEVFGTVSCRSSSACSDGAWFVVVSLLIASAIACVFFYSDPRNDGLISTLVYYYQMIPLFLINRAAAADVITSTLSNLLNFKLQFGGSASGICPFPDLNPVGKQLIALTVPALIALPLAIICIIHVNGWACDDRIRQSFGSFKESLCVLCCRQTARPLLSSGAGESLLDPPTVTAPPTTRGRIAVAFTQLSLYTFSAVVQAIFTLLQCVEIAPAGSSDAPSSRLFISPDRVACYEPWQRALFVVMAVVVLSPLVLAVWIRRHSDAAAGGGSGGAGAIPTTAAVLSVITSPFAPHAVYWECVRLVWRLLLIIVTTFVADAIARGLTLTVISMAMSGLHLFVQPMRDLTSQRFGTLCLSVLLLLGPINLPAASTIANGTVAGAGVDSTFTGLQIFQTIVMLIPAIIGVAFIGKRQLIRCCGGVSSAAGSDAADDDSVVVDRYHKSVNESN